MWISSVFTQDVCICVWMEGREDTLKLYRETKGTLAIQCVHSYVHGSC